MKSLSSWIAATCILALGAGPANATTITETINFTASGFQPAGAPVDPVMGSFTITLDPTVDTPFTVPPVGTTITFNNVNITPGASAPFFFYIANSSGGSLTVCSPAFPASCGETAGFNAFDVRMVNFQSTPTFFDLTYSQSSVNNIFSTTTGSVSVASVPGPIAGAGLAGPDLGVRWPSRLVATAARIESEVAPWHSRSSSCWSSLPSLRF